MLKRAFVLVILIEIHFAYGACMNIPDMTGPLVPATMSGYVIIERDWGPPNYGESPKTDSQHTSILLKLDHPIPFCDSSDAAYYKTQSLDCIQLVDNGPIPLASYLWKHITANGTVFSAHTGWHVTPVVLDESSFSSTQAGFTSVQNINALKTYRCNSTAWSGFRVSAQSTS